MDPEFTRNHDRNGPNQGLLRHKNFRLTTGLTAVLLTTAACAPRQHAAENDAPIVGGTNADIADFPWQVSLQEYRSSAYEAPAHFCGGSIINEFWILTAAHCLEGMEGIPIRVVAGTAKISESDTEGQVADVVRSITYPGYTDPIFGKDVALLRLSEPLKLLEGSGAMAIPLLTAADSPRLAAPGVYAQASGWGALDSDGDYPDHLQRVGILIVESAMAEQAIRGEEGYTDWRITPDQLVAGAWFGGRDSCQGDSGGPLVVRNETGTGHLLAGVVSWGVGCAEPNLPGLYARVSSFTDWIEKTINGPMVAIQSPEHGVELNGQMTLSAIAASDSGTIDRVEFVLPNGESIVDDSAPYEIEWDTTKVADGFAVFEARVFDEENVSGTEDFVEALILNGETCPTEFTAPDVPVFIPSGASGELISTLEIESADQIVGAKLSLDITHENPVELKAWLVSPSGAEYPISIQEHNEGYQIDMVDQPIENTRGESGSGTWELHLFDYGPFLEYDGVLESWSITFEDACYDPNPQNVGAGSKERCVGKTAPGASGWKDRERGGLYLDVDTSHCEYTQAPQYTTSMGGIGWHWTAEGATSIYSPAATGFRIYLATSLTAEEAEDREWHLNWEALPADAAVLGQCHGRTEPGQTEWVQYGTSGIYTDIDTRLCGMESVPLYFASLGGQGSHWSVRGETAIYEPTETGFRIYLYSPGMTPETANELGWYINWSSAPSELSSAALCTGHTEREDWKTYGSGYYVDVDTTRCNFTAEPNYFTSLEGSVHWKSQGGTAIYAPTETGFRIYLKDADATRTRVYWKASAQ